jgi:hypothetical protein
MAWARETKRRVELRLVGKIRWFAVYDLFYYAGDEPAAGLKSILVQTGPDAYQEIYYDVPTEGHPNPSFLVTHGRDTLLCVADNVYKWDAEEECFWFATDGIVRLDFSPVWRAAQKAIPAGRRVWEYNLKARSSFTRMTIPVGIRYEQSSRCCDTGVVSVRFRIERGRVIVTHTDYDADAEYEW